MLLARDQPLTCVYKQLEHCCRGQFHGHALANKRYEKPRHSTSNERLNCATAIGRGKFRTWNQCGRGATGIRQIRAATFSEWGFAKPPARRPETYTFLGDGRLGLYDSIGPEPEQFVQLPADREVPVMRRAAEMSTSGGVNLQLARYPGGCGRRRGNDDHRCWWERCRRAVRRHDRCRCPVVTGDTTRRCGAGRPCLPEVVELSRYGAP